MKDKICIITGASNGIGKEIAKQLAAKGARIVMICRNELRGQIAKKEIENETGSSKIDLFLADLSSISQIKALADNLEKAYPIIDVLINNAGNFFLEKKFNETGIEMTFAVNYLAPFFLTNLLLDNIISAAQGRIIIVSSRNQSWGKIDLENYSFNNRIYNGLQAYSNAKLMTIIFTKELAKRLKGTRVTINAAHPGDVVTNIGMNDNNALFKFIWRIKCMFNIPVEKGAETPVYLASSPEISDISGAYFAKKKIAKYNKIADRPGIGEELWDFTEAIITRNKLSIKTVGLPKSISEIIEEIQYN